MLDKSDPSEGSSTKSANKIEVIQMIVSSFLPFGSSLDVLCRGHSGSLRVSSKKLTLRIVQDVLRLLFVLLRLLALHILLDLPFESLFLLSQCHLLLGRLLILEDEVIFIILFTMSILLFENTYWFTKSSSILKLI